MRRCLLAGAVLGFARMAPAQQQTFAVIDVPFFAQTEDLCGGAAATMVLRYWGDTRVQPEDFSPLVDSSKGGISTGDLVSAITSRGFVASPIHASGVDAGHEIARGRPVIALIDAGRGRFHYVVIVGWAPGRVLFHDPSVGAFRVATTGDFEALWRVTEHWALVVTPGAQPPEAVSPPLTSTPPPSSQASPLSPCDPLVDPAIVLARGVDPESAVPPLMAAMAICPRDPRAVEALAGVRFRQERFQEAAVLARQAEALDPSDGETTRLLATSLYLSDEPGSALGAWNRAGEPRIDRIQIDGLVRTRQDVATRVLGLQARDLLTPDSLTLAWRRLEQLPTSNGAKVTYQPAAHGQANIVASLGEGGLIEPWRILLLRVGIEAGARRETGLRINSPTGRGEALGFGGRFASHRPAAWISLETPRLAGLPGVVTLTGEWDRQAYRLPRSAGEPLVAVETRRRGALEWSHWGRTEARFDLEVAVDRFDSRGTYGSLRGGVDLRFSGDRVAVLGDAAWWSAAGPRNDFADLGGAAVWRSRVSPRTFVWSARLDGRLATARSPLAIWPGAGTGPGRPWLLRASKLLDRGTMVGDAFGRGLLHGTVEGEMRVLERGLTRIGIAVFGDWARPWESSLRAGFGPSILAFGVGLRLRPVSSAAFRLDVAKRPDRKGLVFSAGVIPAWPR